MKKTLGSMLAISALAVGISANPGCMTFNPIEYRQGIEKILESQEGPYPKSTSENLEGLKQDILAFVDAVPYMERWGEVRNSLTKKSAGDTSREMKSLIKDIEASNLREKSRFSEFLKGIYNSIYSRPYEDPSKK